MLYQDEFAFINIDVAIGAVDTSVIVAADETSAIASPDGLERV